MQEESNVNVHNTCVCVCVCVCVYNYKGCEFLEKLDLTVNFVDDLLSVESLRDNRTLQEL